MKLNRARIAFNQPRKDWSGMIENQRSLVTLLYKLLRLEEEARKYAWDKHTYTEEWWRIWTSCCDAIKAIRIKLKVEYSKEKFCKSILHRQHDNLQRFPTISKRSPIVEREHKSRPRNSWMQEDCVDNRKEIDDEIWNQYQIDKSY